MGHSDNMEVLLKLLFATLAIGCVGALVLPVEQCRLEDSTCMRTAFQKAVPVFTEGIPEIGVEVQDPLQMDDLSFDLSGLQFSMKDGHLKGLKSAIMDRVKWDVKKSRIEMNYHMNCTVKGHYTAAGRLLILPITGDGQMKLKLRNLAVKMYIDFKIEKGKNDKDHVVPTRYDFEFEVKDGAHFNLTNLFNGNKELSDTMLLFLNENWKQVSMEFGRPLMEGAAKKVYQNVVTFFSHMPLGDIAIL